MNGSSAIHLLFYLGGNGGGGKGGSVIKGIIGGGAGTGGKGMGIAGVVPYTGVADVANKVLGNL